MNERLKELAEQCHHRYSEHNIDLEKFAELIVRECISALDKEVYIATREDGEQACHEVILLEHFGVKE